MDKYNIEKEKNILGIVDNQSWDGKEEIKAVYYSGFLAQEVDEAAKKVGYNFSGVDKSGKLWGLRYAEFTVPLVKAVKEQQIMIDELKQQNEALKQENLQTKLTLSQLEKRISTLEAKSSESAMKE